MNRDSMNLGGIDNFIRDRVSPPARENRNGINNDLKREVGDFGSKQTPTGRTQPRLAYGGAATGGGNTAGRPGSAVKAHKDDRIHSLERDNLKLKSKSSLLELEIKKYASINFYSFPFLGWLPS